MRKSLFYLFILICLVLPAGLSASTKETGKEKADPIILMLQQYRADGYTVLGPVQYLDKTQGQIILYRHPPVAYDRLRIINKLGIATSVKPEQFVYVLSKKGRVVIIRLKRKEAKDV